MRLGSLLDATKADHRAIGKSAFVIYVCWDEEGKRLFEDNLFTIDDIDTTLQVLHIEHLAAREVINRQL